MTLFSIKQILIDDTPYSFVSSAIPGKVTQDSYSASLVHSFFASITA